MAVDFNDIFNRLGKGGWLLLLVNEFRGAGSTDVIATSLPLELDDYAELFDGDDDELRDVISPVWAALDRMEDGLNAGATTIKTSLQNMLIEIVHDDNPLPVKDLAHAVDELYTQMVANAESIAQNTVTLSIAYGASNTGDGVMVATELDGRGRRLDYAISEDIEFACTDDSTAGAEVFTGSGQDDEGLALLDHNYPTGSGASMSVDSLDSNDNTLVTNADFNDFTTNAPDSWTIVTGVAGTDIFEDTTNEYKGTSCLKFVDDTAEPHITFPIDVDDLNKWVPMGIAVALRTITDTFASGDLIIDLYDGSSVIDDEEGNANSLTVDLTALTTSFAWSKAVFRLPNPVPATVLLRVYGSGILGGSTTSGAAVLIDQLSFEEMTQTYNGGPFVRVASGATDWAEHDTIQLDVSNNEASEFARLVERVLDLRSSGKIVRSTGSPTQADTKIS